MCKIASSRWKPRTWKWIFKKKNLQNNRTLNEQRCDASSLVSFGGKWESEIMRKTELKGQLDISPKSRWVHKSPRNTTFLSECFRKLGWHPHFLPCLQGLRLIFVAEKSAGIGWFIGLHCKCLLTSVVPLPNRQQLSRHPWQFHSWSHQRWLTLKEAPVSNRSDPPKIGKVGGWRWAKPKFIQTADFCAKKYLHCLWASLLVRPNTYNIICIYVYI